MAGGVWGIDIGQCALKAIRCRAASDGKSLIADNFEFIEYPKMLNQPDADPEELVRDALKQFLSRNSLKGDKVCIAVAGQSGLARFIELPPVEPKKLPELVGFEAKQQIPFALEDVVWDYQRMPDVLAAGEDDDFPIENVVGLFAMKREQVLRLIQPLVDAEIEIDIVQLSPVAIYNAVAFDQFPSKDEPPTDPAHWTVVVSMGTENSDIVITNGYRVWQRSIPIGGNHFTKQLTKEMKLTFAKAEHIKRNAREAEDAREVFRAMRPIFNDLVTEIQRTVGYFESLDREAEIQRTLFIGNPSKLPGLTAYVEKSLNRPNARVDNFARLSGPQVTNEPLFRDNTLAFFIAYGLALQGLGLSRLKTNLLPREILQQRLIRSKKPWFVALAAALLLGMAFNFFFNFRAWYSVHGDYRVNNVSWSDAESKVGALGSEVASYESRDQEQLNQLARLNEVGDTAVGSADGRMLWLELMKAITAALPNEVGPIEDLQKKPPEQRKEIYIQKLESKFFPDLSQWFDATVQEKYSQQNANRKEMDANARDVEAPDLSGKSGWVIEIQGIHFQHHDQPSKGTEYVRHYLVDQLEFGEVELPVGEGDQVELFKLSELGIMAPVEIAGELDSNFTLTPPDAEPDTNNAAVGGELARMSGFGRPGFQSPQQKPASKTTIAAKAYKFTVQFCWTQITSEKRLEQRRLQKSDAAEQEGEPVAAN